MDAIILCGGLGTRLRSVVNGIPKPMAAIGDRPFLSVLLDRLTRVDEIDRVILSTGYLSNVITSYFGNSFNGLRIEYCEEKTALGTGGAIYKAFQMLESSWCMVQNGDTYLDFSVSEIVKSSHWQEKNIIVAKKLEKNSRYGLLVLQNDKVIGFKEKMSENLPGYINAGTYFLRKDLFSQQNQLGEVFSFEKDFLPNAVCATEFYAYKTSGQFIDIGVPEDYFVAQSILKV